MTAKTTSGGITYVFATEDCHFKVGCSNDWAKRLGQLQTGNPQKVWFYGGTLPGTGVLARDFEQAVHEQLASYRTSGEWFFCSEGTLVEAWRRAWMLVTKANDNGGLGR